MIWQKSLGGWGTDVAFCMVEQNGFFYIGGYTNSNNGDVVGFHGMALEYDGWIIKIDSNSNIIWSRAIGGDLGEIIYSLSSNNQRIVFTGDTRSINGDLNGISLFGSTDYMIGELNNDSLIWINNYGGSEIDICQASIIDNNDQIVLAGLTTSSNGQVTGYNNGPNCLPDIWLVKLNDDFSTNLLERNEKDVLVFPNPATDKIKLSISSNQKQQRINVRISDLLGNVLVTQSKILPSGEMDVSELPAGCYLVSVNINNQSYIFKLIKL